MRVLIVNDYATPTGGAELAALALRRALRERGHESALFASRASPSGAPIQADYSCSGTTGSLRAVLQTANPGARRALSRALASFRPDVVHVRLFLTQLSPLILPVLADVPSLLHVATYRPVCPVGTKQLPDGRACHVRPGRACLGEGCLPLRDWLPIMLQHRGWRRKEDAFDRIVANSDWVAERLRDGGVTVHGVLPEGVPERGARPPLTGPPTVGFAGRLVREKGVRVLLRAMARVVDRMPEARLLIAGSGPEERPLQEATRSLGIEGSVSFRGWVARDRLDTELGAAWVQAVPSTWEEPFGLVAAEAMMRGTAVVASETGGLTEQVRDGRTGRLVPSGDPDRLADALLAYLGDRALAEATGREARSLALEHLTERRYAEEVMKAYGEIRT